MCYPCLGCEARDLWSIYTCIYLKNLAVRIGHVCLYEECEIYSSVMTLLIDRCVYWHSNI